MIRYKVDNIRDLFGHKVRYMQFPILTAPELREYAKECPVALTPVS